MPREAKLVLFGLCKNFLPEIVDPVAFTVLEGKSHKACVTDALQLHSQDSLRLDMLWKEGCLHLVKAVLKTTHAIYCVWFQFPQCHLRSRSPQ